VESATAAALSLLSAAAVRERASRMLSLALEGRLAHFRIDLDRLEAAADLVVDTIRRSYPSGDIPFHSRWRHFSVGARDRWAELDRATAWRDAAERARAAFDLAIVSVLLDAGAGAQWAYFDAPTGSRIGRSEGLAIASLDMFAAGAFSLHGGNRLRADAAALAAMTGGTLGRYLQVGPGNPLPGVEGRADLLHRLGATVAANHDVFALGDAPRPGGLFDYIVGIAHGGSIAAPAVLHAVLRHLGPIWPSRLALGGVALGDCWRYPALSTEDATTGLVPLHKLSQWLTYSLLEPLQEAGLVVSDIDGLTGLAEYRNGGLMIDTGVLALRDPADGGPEHDIGSELIVEWRALTVALLDRLADVVRRRLNGDSVSLPLARILQGGTWAAGRRIARESRPDGSPPLAVASDGTVF
jgi:hypothetical protein